MLRHEVDVKEISVILESELYHKVKLHVSILKY